MASKKKWRRSTPTPGEVARFRALQPKGCLGCFRIRFALYFCADGYCRDCNDDPVSPEQLMKDRKFVREFRRRFLGGTKR